MGDPAGIGPEVLAKAISPPLRKEAGEGKNSFLIIGDGFVLRRYLKKLPPRVQFLDLKNISRSKLIYGQANRHSARAALEYLDIAIVLLKNKKISALVTAPVCKEAIVSLGVDFPGHTEYLAQAFGVKKVGMMFVGKNLKTVLTTRHIPIAQVSRSLTQNLILEIILLTHEGLKKFFKKNNPQIAVCGLNPHAGEWGTIGKEEMTTIIPALRQAQKKGIHVHGPFSADTLFYPKHSEQFDCIISMYHDQGLIAIKAFEFHNLVNLTLGLPFVRTSPAHGTALDIVGQNKANPSSMVAAIELAKQLIA